MNGPIRVAQSADIRDLYHFIQRAPRTHVHADYRPLSDWIGHPGFLLQQQGKSLVACVAVAADPPPAAWVRLVALEHDGPGDEARLAAMLDRAGQALAAQGVTEIGWLTTQDWVAPWLAELGFDPAPVNRVETLTRPVGLALALPPASEMKAIQLRPVEAADMAALASMEREAFAPLWRHSPEGLVAAWRQASSFVVAVADDRPVGFQYSASSQNGAHLVRLTVHPEWQRQGIGSALLEDALREYRRQGLATVTLNTQVDNDASLRLYARYGFRRLGDSVPVWLRRL